MGFFIFLHFALITAIICLVLVQRSAESTILTSSTHFAPGGANKMLVKITRICVAVFVINCLLISYLKYGKTLSNLEKTKVKTEKTSSVPTE